jgi:tetratricopeptide (TPR) repeat protein
MWNNGGCEASWVLRVLRLTMMRPLSWKSFLLRWLVLLLAAAALSIVTFFVCQWLMPPMLAWVRARATFQGGADLVQRLDQIGAVGMAGLAFVGAVTVGRGWCEAARPRRQDLPLTAVTEQVVFGTIPLPSWCFQPRPVQQTRLRQSLAVSGRNAALVALPGARGVGKSQLAAAYARDCVDAGYALVAWINAESGPVTSLAQLAEKLGLGSVDQSREQLAAKVRSVLQTRDGIRRLIVFDNVEDPAGLTGFLPTSGNAEVVITSTRQEFSTMAGITSIPVEPYTSDQGRAFLAEATGLPDDADAAKTGHELGWLPLGLTQAAAYMRRNKLDHRQYLTALTTHDLDETLTWQAGADHSGILKVVAVSLAGMNRHDPTGLCGRLLTVLSVLSADGVSRSLLTGQAVRTVWQTDPSGMARALRTLADASLITVSRATPRTHGTDRTVIAVHRLTARVIRHLASRSRSTTLTEAITIATELLETLIQEDNLPLAQVAQRRTELDELVAHILAVGDHAPRPHQRLLTLCDWAGEALLEAGDLTRALPILGSTLANREQILGGGHPDTMLSRNNLAGGYAMAGRLDEAIALFEIAVAERERALGTDHPDTLVSRSNLAYVYQTVDRLDEAIALYEATLADRERTLGRDDPDTLLNRNNLAYAYRAAGRLDEAVALFEATLTDRQRTLGSQHRDTLFSRSNLAGAYLLAGRVDEAVALFEATLADRERILGSDHPHTLDSRSKLADAYASVGNLDKAISLYRTALADSERVLSADHIITKKIRSNLHQATNTPTTNPDPTSSQKP